jgi:arylsulfatase A-like enzyme/Tfp pilus assembly protein PilF
MKRLPIAIGGGLAALGLVLAGCGLFETPPPNVLLISVDTLRQDHVGCYGYKIVRTPNIDRLSEEGFTFDDAIASIPLTLPSHASVLTGLYPISHGVRDNSRFRLALEFETLAEVLRQNGYHTGGFVGSFVLDSRYGMDQGFDFYDDDMTGGSQASAFMFPERPANAVTESAIEWLEQARSPFFAFVHYYDPHMPYEPPSRYATSCPGRPYDGEIEFTDTEIGRLLASLDVRGLIENTIIIFMSDHGEGLGDHNEEAHGILVYESTLRVPLIIRLPETSDLSGGAQTPVRIPDSVELVDIFPTVLDLVGIDAGGGVDGRSLVPLIAGGSLPPETGYFESLYPYFAYRWSQLKGVRLSKWKYILAPTEELYDVSVDPGEFRNLVDAEPETAAQMRVALARMLEREKPPSEASAVAMSPEEVGKLRALGYVAGGATDLPEPTDVSGKDPKDMMVYVNHFLSVGENAFNDGDYETALRSFRRFTEVDPTNLQAHIRVARTLMELGRFEEAAASFHRALEIDSTDSQSYFQLGNIAQAGGDVDDALRLYERSLHFMPGSPEALANIGAALIQKGLVDSGVVRLEETLEIDPRNDIALLNLGIVYSSNQMYDEALGYYRRLLLTQPDNVMALSSCAAIFVHLGEPDSTLAYFLRASRAAPGSPQLLLNVGNSYRQMGMNAEAEEYYQKALRVQPRNVLALFGIAAIRAAEGNREDSADILRRILEIEPDFEPARAALEKISSGS